MTLQERYRARLADAARYQELSDKYLVAGNAYLEQQAWEAAWLSFAKAAEAIEVSEQIAVAAEHELVLSFMDQRGLNILAVDRREV